MGPFTVKHEAGAHQSAIFQVSGYVAKEAGEELNKAIDAVLLAGTYRIIIDLSHCTILTSPGISAILRASVRILDDFSGRIILTGLDDSKRDVLTFTGVIPVAETAPTLQDALSLLPQGK